MTWISGLFLKNYKPFKELNDGDPLPLGRLTILFGRNGSGKSSLLEAMALAAQNADPSRGQVMSSRFLEDGPMVAFSSSDNAFHGRDMGEELGIGLVLTMPDGELERFVEVGDFRPPAGMDLGWVHYYYGFLDPQAYQGKGSVRANGQGLWVKDDSGKEECIFSAEREMTRIPGGGWSGPSFIVLPMVDPEEKLQGGLAEWYLDAGQIRSVSGEERHRTSLLMGVQIVSFLRQFLWNNVYYLSAGRGDYADDGRKERSGRRVDTRLFSVGVRGEKTTEVLGVVQGRRAAPDAWGKIVEWCSSFGMPGLRAGSIGERVEVSFVDPENETPLDVRMGGLGSRQMLSVVTQCFAAPPSSVVLMEEPENSLHLEAQAKLPQLFSDVLERGVQLVVTTHSKLLVHAIRHAVRKGVLRVNDLVVYDLDKKQKGVEARRVVVKPDGTIPEWIPSFSEVENRLFDEWATED